MPESVTLSKQYPIADSIDIYANWEIVSKDATISGNITYQGDWPEDTSLLLFAIYRIKPTSELQYLFFENVDYAQPLFTSTSSYRLSVGAGSYTYIALFWIGENISSITDLVQIGIYEDPANPGEPGTVEVNSGDDIGNININVDFEKIIFPNK